MHADNALQSAETAARHAHEARLQADQLIKQMQDRRAASSARIDAASRRREPVPDA
jgi:hypothetical protein